MILNDNQKIREVRSHFRHCTAPSDVSSIRCHCYLYSSSAMFFNVGIAIDVALLFGWRLDASALKGCPPSFSYNEKPSSCWHYLQTFWHHSKVLVGIAVELDAQGALSLS